MRSVLYMLAASFLLVSCEKEKPEDISFDVSTTSLSYKAGDSVVFQFNGNADNIVFFSGEPGKAYENKDRTSVANKLEIDFRTWVQFGLIYQNLQLLVSGDFNGMTADTNSIKAATWSDISSLATFSSGTDSVFSGVVNLTDYAQGINPLYVAFRYTDYKKQQGQNRWVIRTFSARKVSPEGKVTSVAEMGTAGWVAVNFKNLQAKWSIAATQLQMSGGTDTAADNDDWVISKAFPVTVVDPDKGTALKNTSTALTAYTYVYKTPGTYHVVFEGSTQRYNGEGRLIREMTLVITP